MIELGLRQTGAKYIVKIHVMKRRKTNGKSM